MENSWNPEYGNTVIIGHGDCIERAEECACKILEKLPSAEVQIADVGPIIGAHTGPGLLVVVFWGNER